MTSLIEIKPQFDRAFGGDYTKNTQQFLRLKNELSSALQDDAAGVDKYNDLLRLETVTFTQELADRKRVQRQYPRKIKADIDENWKKLTKRIAIWGGVLFAIILAFVLFSGSVAPLDTRLIIGGIGILLGGSVLGIRSLITWRLYKKYIDQEILYRLPDTDFVTPLEQDDFQMQRREEDATLIMRLHEMKDASERLQRKLDSAPHNLYSLDKSGLMAVVAYQSLVDNGESDIGTIAPPTEISLCDPEIFKDARESEPKTSNRVVELLMKLEIMIKTVSDRIGY